jgi:hypothetical protein
MVAYSKANTLEAAQHQGFDDGYFRNEKLDRFKYPKHRHAYEDEYQRGVAQRKTADLLDAQDAKAKGKRS